MANKRRLQQVIKTDKQIKAEEKARHYQLQVEIGKAETVYGTVRLRKEDTETDGGNKPGNQHPLLNSQQFAGLHKPESVVTYENTDPNVQKELQQEFQQKYAKEHGISSAPTASKT